MIEPDGVHAVEQYVLAKYYMTTNVYRHRVRLITDQMLVRAIVLGIDVDQNDDLLRLYSFDNSDEFCRRYTEWDDARCLLSFGADSHSTSHCGRLLGKLRTRRLHKQVFSETVQEFGPEITELLMGIKTRENDTIRLRIEAALAEAITEHFKTAVDPGEVIIHASGVRSVRTLSRNDEAAMLVRRSTPVSFEDESSLFRSINESISDGMVAVYAPVEWEDRTHRNRALRALAGPLRERIVSLARRHTEKGAP